MTPPFEEFRDNYRTTKYLAGITGLASFRIRYIVHSRGIRHIKTPRLYIHKSEFLEYLEKNPSELLNKSRTGR